jgi:hypothetical protein
MQGCGFDFAAAARGTGTGSSGLTTGSQDGRRGNRPSADYRDQHHRALVARFELLIEIWIPGAECSLPGRVLFQTDVFEYGAVERLPPIADLVGTLAVVAELCIALRGPVSKAPASNSRVVQTASPNAHCHGRREVLLHDIRLVEPLPQIDRVGDRRLGLVGKIGGALEREVREPPPTTTV